MKTLKKLLGWDWLTLKRLAYIMNFAVLVGVVSNSITWVSLLGKTVTVTRTIADLITTFALIGMFWASGYMLGMVSPENIDKNNNEHRQL